MFCGLFTNKSAVFIAKKKSKLEGNVSKNETFKYNIVDFDNLGKVLEEIAVCKSCKCSLKLCCKLGKLTFSRLSMFVFIANFPKT